MPRTSRPNALGRTDEGSGLVHLALTLDHLGWPTDAIRELDRAVSVLTGIDRDRARVHRATILRRLGREEEALASYRVALASFRRAGDRLWQARALTHRGLLRAGRGDLRGAERDLRRAEVLYADLGDTEAVAQVRHNLGFVAARAGDIPAALGWYDRADEDFRRHGRPAQVLIDWAELLLHARLWPEAYVVAATAARTAANRWHLSLLPQARLLQAQAALATGDSAGARAAAAAARAAFRRQGRSRWTVLADYVIWRAAPVPAAGPAWFATAAGLAERLTEAGWRDQALEARIHAAEAALTLTTGAAGAGAAMAELARAVATIPRGPARLRARALYGRALALLYEGNQTRAKRALTASLRVLEAYRDTLGAVELRVNASAEGTGPAMLGLRLAMLDRNPRAVLTWAERHRAVALRPAPGPRPSAELTDHLAQLRRLAAQLSAVDLDPARLAGLRRRQQQLEEAIRRLSWRTPAPSVLRRPVEAIRPHLGQRALVELVHVEGALAAVVLVGHRTHLRDLGSMDEITAETAALRFALRRLALRVGTTRSLEAARTAADHSARRLDALLLAPLRRLIGDAPLVLVPTGVLFGLPWPLLATCRARTVQVAPSVRLWCAAQAGSTAAQPDDQPGGRPVVLVAPATPPNAGREVHRIAQTRPDAVVLAGPQATVSSVLAALDGAGVAHLAAHGRFRADNPLFSQVSLADGPLTGYDLLRLNRPPDLVVVSACETGHAGVREGDELMGFAAAMLGLGTRAVVASVSPVDDEATARLMVELHRRLRAGTAPAAALTAAQVATAGDPYDSTYGFICFGAG